MVRNRCWAGTNRVALVSPRDRLLTGEAIEATRQLDQFRASQPADRLQGVVAQPRQGRFDYRSVLIDGDGDECLAERPVRRDELDLSKPLDNLIPGRVRPP
jgi:hypothetical protein